LAAQRAATMKGEILTGLLYIDPEAAETHQFLNTTSKPLNTLTEKELCPGSSALDRINASLR
jgi:2-oxoglutarate ferredoxin oxidoreductase subunit beta